jgi:hypothetical protein
MLKSIWQLNINRLPFIIIFITPRRKETMKKINVVLVLFLSSSMALSACGGSAPAATEAPVKAPTEAPVVATEAPVIATEAPVAERITPMIDGGVPMTAEEDEAIAKAFAQRILDAVAIQDSEFYYEGYFMPHDISWKEVQTYYTDLAASNNMSLADELTFRLPPDSLMMAFKDKSGALMFVVYTRGPVGVAISLAYGNLK